jgi:poly(3-hydroxybutyrate) depolymerase
MRFTQALPLFVLLSIHASVFALTGTVKNGKGAAISGATVSLTTAPAKTASSNANGEFALETGTAVQPRDVRSFAQFDLEGGRLLVSTDPGIDPEGVFLVAGDGRSHALATPAQIAPGRFSYALPELSSGLYLVGTGKDRTVVARLLSTGDSWVSASGARKDAFAADAARSQVAIQDTLVASKTGYVTKKTPLTSYDVPVSIVLDSALAVGRSAGCDKTAALANGTLTIQSGGKSRKYILKIPADYDKSKPYRLVFAFAESGSSAQSVANRNYFRMAGYDSKGTIFVAPDAENGAGSWSKADVTLTDDILAQLKGGLCIDTTRIFATGFSFGGAMSLALACTRADVFRGVAFFSGADLTGSCPSTPLSKPIAYYASQASGDASGAPIPTSGRIKQAQFAAVNGCTEEPNATVFPAAGKAHTCTVYKNCKAGYPTVYCVFNGAHGWEPVDPGQSTSWNPPEAWKFITQF